MVKQRVPRSKNMVEPPVELPVEPPVVVEEEEEGLDDDNVFGEKGDGDPSDDEAKTKSNALSAASSTSTQPIVEGEDDEKPTKIKKKKKSQVDSDLDDEPIITKKRKKSQGNMPAAKKNKISDIEAILMGMDKTEVRNFFESYMQKNFAGEGNPVYSLDGNRVKMGEKVVVTLLDKSQQTQTLKNLLERQEKFKFSGLFGETGIGKTMTSIIMGMIMYPPASILIVGNTATNDAVNDIFTVLPGSDAIVVKTLPELVLDYPVLDGDATKGRLESTGIRQLLMTKKLVIVDEFYSFIHGQGGSSARSVTDLLQAAKLAQCAIHIIAPRTINEEATSAITDHAILKLLGVNHNTPTKAAKDLSEITRGAIKQEELGTSKTPGSTPLCKMFTNVGVAWSHKLEPNTMQMKHVVIADDAVTKAEINLMAKDAISDKSLMRMNRWGKYLAQADVCRVLGALDLAKTEIGKTTKKVVIMAMTLKTIDSVMSNEAFPAGLLKMPSNATAPSEGEIPVYFYGSSRRTTNTSAERHKIRKFFREFKGAAILVCPMDKCSTSLTLSDGQSEMLMMVPPINRKVMSQSLSRIRRVNNPKGAQGMIITFKDEMTQFSRLHPNDSQSKTEKMTQFNPDMGAANYM